VLRGVNEDPAIPYGNRPGPQRDRARRTGWRTRQNVETSLVEGAFDFRTINIPICERARTVGTFILGHVILPIDLEDCQFFALHFGLEWLVRRHVLNTAEIEKFRMLRQPALRELNVPDPEIGTVRFAPTAFLFCSHYEHSL